jgi:SAM-dependent methyltransferase
MNSKTVVPSKRGRFNGMMQILRYNWPQYVVSVVIVVLGAVWGCVGQGPEWFRAVALIVALPAAWWCLASLIASFWIYDLSPLYRWTWISNALPATPQYWLSLHAGLDESSSTIRQLFPDGEGRVGDFYNAAEMSEPSIQRARAEQKCNSTTERVDYRKLPFPGESFDAVFLLFAAHELRRAESREAFIREVRRVLSPSGTVLLVEHVRDLANFAAFGPGFLHFMPAGEWRRLAEIAGLNVVREERMTPFVKIILLARRP